MAGNVVNFKVCSPLKLRSGLTGKCGVRKLRVVAVLEYRERL